ncbi:glycosyl hydrolase [Burkholderia ubonensis]|nr:glycosyl hydrolase [Burkholderia ubonensis]
MAPAFLYSPYKDATISMNWNTNVISSNVTGQMSPVLSVLPSNVRALTLAFATGECGSENWAGVDGGALAAANVPLFTAANVNYVISTGGAAGSFTCGSDAGMATFINRYASNNLVGIDFDIEAGQTQQVINDLVQRVVVAQQNYPNLRFSFTLATLAPSQPGAVMASSWGASAPDSFNIYGDWVMQAIQTYGLKNYTINLMTMDYGSAGPGNCVVANGTCQMGQSAIQAAMNLHDHWGVPYSQMELTPMIGGNDVAGETFTPADADTTAAFVKQNGLVGVHFWSFDRDVDCPPGAASSTCNSIGGVGTLGYTNRFASDLASGR